VRLAQRGERVREGLRNALKTDRLFDQAVTQGTGDPRKVVKRFEVIERLIQSILAENDNVAGA
jgi:hypothetical protein